MKRNSIGTAVILSSLVLSLVTGCATPTAGGAPAPATSVASAPAESTTVASKEDDQELVCFFSESTGSRVRRQKICKTREQLRTDEEKGQEFLRGFEESGSTQPGGQSLQGN